MKLTKRNNGIWMVSVTIDGRRIRKSTGERDKGAAQQRAVSLIAELRKAAGDCDWTLSDALRDCYDRVWCEQKSSVHVWKRIEKLDRDFPEFARTHLPAVTYDRLIDLAKVMEDRGAKNATINRYFALISKALVEAVKRGKLEQKPLLPYRKESKGKLRWITKAEEQRLLTCCAHLWVEAEAEAMRSLIIVLVDTGARLSEVLGHPRLPVRQATFMDTKNSLSRQVPLTDRARDALPCIPMWTAMAAIGRFSRLRDYAGYRDVSLHTLRHTCASRLVQAGMDLYRVKEWLGHSSITVTQRYAHLSPSNLTAGADLLAQFED